MFLIPQKRSFNHIYLTFSLSNMIYTCLSKKCRESHLRTSTGQIAHDAWIGGWLGGIGVNLIQAMPVFWKRMVRQPIHKANKFALKAFAHIVSHSKALDHHDCYMLVKSLSSCNWSFPKQTPTARSAISRTLALKQCNAVLFFISVDQACDGSS